MNRKHIHIPANLGDKVADSVVAGMGSWKFIIIQSIVVLAWISGNLYLLTRPFDPFPFVFLNLLFSTQAAYASPLILMASNRSAKKDAVRDDLEAQEVAELYTINKHQLDELTKLDEIITILKES